MLEPGPRSQLNGLQGLAHPFLDKTVHWSPRLDADEGERDEEEDGGEKRGREGPHHSSVF